MMRRSSRQRRTEQTDRTRGSPRLWGACGLLSAWTAFALAITAGDARQEPRRSSLDGSAS